jgi:hypothetical protein
MHNSLCMRSLQQSPSAAAPVVLVQVFLGHFLVVGVSVPLNAAVGFPPGQYLRERPIM